MIDLADHLQKLQTDNAEAAVNRIWNYMHYGNYVEQRKLDTGKLFILGMLAKGIDSPQLFLEKLQSLRATIAEHRNAEDNRIILSTIHSSKGLEYDTVYMADVVDGILPSITREEIENDDDLKLYEEERRLYYVGMTRAKNDLYLFRCGDPSSFTDEVTEALPTEIIDESDVLAPLLFSQIGKQYTDREWGRGELVAECEGANLIAFPKQRCELMSFGEMLSRRRIRTSCPTPVPAGQKSSDESHGTEERHATVHSSSQLRVGTKVWHKKFGEGIVRSINEKEDVIIIEFEKKGIKRIGLAMSLKKCLLRVCV